MDTAIKHPVPDWVKLSFVIFDIWALCRSGLPTCAYGFIAVPYGNSGREIVKTLYNLSN